MGLDVTAYKRVTWLEAISEWDFARSERAEKKDYLSDDGGPFAAHGEGTLPGHAFTYEDTFSFGAGSYFYYNIWRGWLSRWAADASPEALWADKENATDRPFHWLIAFSDSYGALGPKACKALAHDFAAYADKLPPDSEPWMVERYALFRKAFAFAADDGFVLFH
mgnify:CR=1 FL=1